MNDNYFNDISQYLSQLQALDKLFQEWNYHPTIVPLMDAQAPYQNISDAQWSQNFRVLDANREILLLRADSTLFLARTISTHIRKDILPLRVCYSNSVVRPSKEINNYELWQSGIELIGVPSIAGDFEIILLVNSALQFIAPSQYRIHIGSRKIVELCVMHFIPNITLDQLTSVYNALQQRDLSAISSFTNKDFAQIMLCIMEIKNFENNKNKIAQFLPANNKALLEYDTLIKSIAKVVPADSIRCDFSEVGNHNYYTNIVFSAYAHRQPSPVAQGGRYDGLMQHFGINVPAVGATIFPHMLIDYIITHNSSFNKTFPSTSISNTFNALSNDVIPTVSELVKCASEYKTTTHPKDKKETPFL